MDGSTLGIRRRVMKQRLALLALYGYRGLGSVKIKPIVDSRSMSSGWKMSGGVTLQLGIDIKLPKELFVYQEFLSAAGPVPD